MIDLYYLLLLLLPSQSPESRTYMTITNHQIHKVLEYRNNDGSPLLPEAAFNLMALYKEVNATAAAAFAHLCH